MMSEADIIEYHKLTEKLELLKKQVVLYKKMYDDKVKEFNKYKKEHP